MYRLLLLIFFWPNLIFSAVFIDVRTAEEYESESIMNTQNIEWQNISDIQNFISKDEEIFLFCRSGNRSGKAQKILVAEGYTCLLYTSPSPRDATLSRMPSSA